MRTSSLRLVWLCFRFGCFYFADGDPRLRLACRWRSGRLAGEMGPGNARVAVRHERSSTKNDGETACEGSGASEEPDLDWDATSWLARFHSFSCLVVDPVLI
jgi:hypothetical protein